LDAYALPPAPGDLPVLPSEDLDEKMCVLSSVECERWFELIDLIRQRAPKFKAPQGTGSGIDDEEAEELVRFILKSIDAMRELSLQDPRLVTFIG
jgi:hypothetical protein